VSQNWKRVEDRVCRQLGGRRKLGNRGSAVSDGDEDVPFAVEVKAGYGRFRLARDWLDQCRRQSESEGKPWLLVQVPRHCRKPLVTCELETLLRLIQMAGEGEELKALCERAAGEVA
jgi:hypothetical protein